MKSNLQNADVLLKNGYIYTADANERVAEALAIKNDYIAAVGSNGDILNLIGPDTTVYDLDGMMVVPGMIDSHLHPPAPKMMQSSLIYLSNPGSKEQMIATIKDFICKNPSFPSFYGWGWKINLFDGEERMFGPKKETLDQICADRSVILQSNDGHSMWANSKALELSGLSKSSPDPQGGTIMRDPLTGELWGTLTGTARTLLPQQKFTKEQLTKAVKSFQAYMHSLGYTGFFSAGTKPENLQNIFKTLDDNQELKMWVRDSQRIDLNKNETPAEQLDFLIDKNSEFNSELYSFNTAKIFLDGVVEAGTARLIEPYEKALGKGSNYHGMYYWDDMEALVAAIIKANSAGLQVHIHSIGDQATRDALDAYDKALRKVPGEHRNSIAHLQLVRPEDLKRFYELGVIANVQPYWHYKQSGWWKEVEYANIGERAEYQYPLKSLVTAGATLACSSDYPVVENPDPLLAIKAGITRNLYDTLSNGTAEIDDIDDERWLLNKNERISLGVIIKSLTANNAYALKIEDVTGSIEAGKFADLTIINENLFNLDPLDINRAKVVKTFFHGKIVYDA